MTYSEIMRSSDAYIEIALDLDEPVEIADFAALFAGFGSEFERYLNRERPELSGSARMYVKEVRKGSVIAALFADIPDMIGIMDSALIVLAFGALFNRRLRDLVQGKRLDEAGKPQLNDLTKTLRAIAEDKSGTMTIKGFRWHDGLFSTDFEATFTAREARAALNTIEGQRRDLDKITTADHSRILMRFTRSDVGSAQVGKRSGERVIVDDLSDKPLPLVYGSDFAEERIKDVIRNSDENIYKCGFIVDLNLVFTGPRPVAYSVTHVHQVIDLPDDD
ncbi:MAG: hypothetical protein JXJ18_13690 [Rhodobacteraceae bacterium]|nr:hypothetical protein [Paracoccaceae bacterium]